MNAVNYWRVLDFVKSNSWNLEVYTRQLRTEIVKPKDYVTITWNRVLSDGLPEGYYVTGRHNDTKEVFNIITVDADNYLDKIITLLHEYGHYTSDQTGGVLSKEVNAWVDCIKWMRHLNIPLCNKGKGLISKCLGTYLDKHGHSTSVLQFFKKYNIPYKVNDWDNYCQVGFNLPTLSFKKDYITRENTVYGGEVWKNE